MSSLEKVGICLEGLDSSQSKKSKGLTIAKIESYTKSRSVSCLGVNYV